MPFDEQETEDLKYLLGRFKNEAKKSGKSYRQMVDEFFAYHQEGVPAEQPKEQPQEPQKEEKPLEAPFELGDAGYSLLPKDVAEYAKKVMLNKSQVFIHTRCGNADHRVHMWGKNRFKRFMGHPAEFEYLSNPYEIFSSKGTKGGWSDSVSKFPEPFNNYDLAERIWSSIKSGKNTLIFNGVDTNQEIYSQENEKLLPMMMTYNVKTTDPSGRSTVPSIMLTLEKEDFNFLSTYLRGNPQHATPIFYGVPIEIVKENNPEILKDEKTLIKCVEERCAFDKATEHLGPSIAAIYYYCKFLPEKVYGRFGDASPSTERGRIDTNPVEIIDLVSKE